MTTKRYINNYKQAVMTNYRNDLFAVEMEDGGWSIADGEGILLTPEDEIDYAGWHLPVCFSSQEEAIKCIKYGHKVMFDVTIDAIWTKAAIMSGASYRKDYEM